MVDVDAARLRSYLERELGEEVTGFEVLSDKLNLVVSISTRDESDAYVLHCPTELRDTGLFNGLRQEYRLLQELRETAVPTQVPVSFCDDESVLGAPFYVTTYLEGTTIQLTSESHDRLRNAQSHDRISELVVDTLAEIHELDAATFDDACARRTPREEVEHTVEQLDAATSATGRDPSTLRAVADWLRRNAPAESEPSLVHGDFRPGNLLFTETAHPEVTGVLDWETAVLAHPSFDLGYLLFRYQVSDDLSEAEERGLPSDPSDVTLPDCEELVARYENRTGLAFENGRFYRAYAALSLAAVWEHLHGHQLRATGSSGWEQYVDYAAMVADGIVGGES